MVLYKETIIVPRERLEKAEGPILDLIVRVYNMTEVWTSTKAKVRMEASGYIPLKKKITP